MAKNKPVAKKKKRSNRIVVWWKETWGELKKVSWPSRAEAWSLTKVVIAVMAVMALLLFVLDLGFQSFFNMIFSL